MVSARARAAAVFALLALVAGAAGAVAKEVPFLSGRVVDEANLLPPDRAAALEEELRRLEEETGAQVVVLTVETLEGEVLEDYALRVAETWEIGRGDGIDDGVVLLVARDDRKLRIEVGYGLEGVLPDLATKRIIDGVIVPRFKAGDFAGGVEAGVDSIAGAIREEPGAVPDEAPGAVAMPDLAGRGFMGLIFLIVVGTFSMIALGAKGCNGWGLYAFLIPFYFTFPLAIFGVSGVVLGFAWLIGFPLLRLFLDRTPAGRRFKTASPMMRSLGRMAASSGGFRGGGGGGGGFSGGGGSFGGGGASGSW